MWRSMRPSRLVGGMGFTLAPMLFNSFILLYYFITLKFNLSPQLIHRKYQVFPHIYTEKILLGRKNLLRVRENAFKYSAVAGEAPAVEAIAEDDTGLAVKRCRCAILSAPDPAVRCGCVLPQPHGSDRVEPPSSKAGERFALLRAGRVAGHSNADPASAQRRIRPAAARPTPPQKTAPAVSSARGLQLSEVAWIKPRDPVMDGRPAAFPPGARDGAACPPYYFGRRAGAPCYWQVGQLRP